ncbi:hypothetical protein ABIB89_003244 [Bradyrhizobium sp. JR3.12]
MLRAWQIIRCFFALLFYGETRRERQHEEFRDELAEARARYREANQRAAKALGSLLDNLEYDRIVHNDSVVPFTRTKRHLH